jgi:uncharacterized protein (DUF2141 family)
MNKAISIATTLIFATCLATAASSETLKLTVETTSEVGSIYAAVYSSADAFEKGEITTSVAGAVSGGKTELEIHNLKPGTYGIVLFHDLNGNEELDRNLFGMPREPFGFSNNPVIQFSAPKFEAFKFEFDGEPMELSITMNGV